MLWSLNSSDLSSQLSAAIDGSEGVGNSVKQGVPVAEKYPVLKSAISPIDVVDLQSANAAELVLSDEDDRQVLQRFERGMDAAIQEDWSTATSEFESLIKDYPTVIEPYINLSAVYAKTKQLEKSRETLLQGLNANSNYQILFDNLQAIHGKLAAEAYRMALTEDANLVEGDELRLSLPLVNAINMQVIKNSRNQISESTTDNQTRALTEAQNRIEVLESELDVMTEKHVQEVEELDKKIAILESQLTTQLLPRSVPKRQISTDNSFISTELGDELAERWTAFEVPKDTNHQTWNVQRQANLLNQDHLAVAVNDTAVEEQNELLNVTFLQNYKSNIVDDTVQKQLVFSKLDMSFSRHKNN